MEVAVASSLAHRVAREIGCADRQAAAAIELLDGGASVPFVARYRKEVTGGLDDAQLRQLEERLSYLRELDSRKVAVLKAVSEQGVVPDGFEAALAAATTKAEVEDLYLPYRKKRKTRADQAREKGLGPLADRILEERPTDVEALASQFITEDVPDVKSALSGARDILSEKFAEDAETAGKARNLLQDSGILQCKVIEGKEAEGAKFSDYFDHSEPLKTAPSHRVLAMLRARDNGIIQLDINEQPATEPAVVSPCEHLVMRANDISPSETWLAGVAKWAWKVKLYTRLSIDLMTEIRERAENEAIQVFSRNLKDLLLAAPAGQKCVLGLDPGVRTGVKAAVVSGTGKVLATDTFYPLPPRNDVAGTIRTIQGLVSKFGVEIIAVGNGTGGRETEAVVAQAIKGIEGRKPIKVTVSEAGASVYSASELASRELPDLDVTLRGAVSIARRLQDPLAELVKIEPKSIGVGQYQHDVNQVALGRALDAAVEDAVNAVGVEVNTASPSLLARVAGIGRSLADSIVHHRDMNGPFATRADLMKVQGLGVKAFEQAAGFLRITNGSEPLDASGVHPEAYDLARKILQVSGGKPGAIDKKKLKAAAFVDDRFGIPTVTYVISELEKPGRDPRPEFKTATFDDAVREMSDLKPGMRLEGTVTNVAAFGAFVDIGVHQDGLVHISQLADQFVKDPSDVVRPGQVVRVTVTDIDIPRKRISLSMKKAPEIGGKEAASQTAKGSDRSRTGRKIPSQAKRSETGALGAALQDALRRR